LQIIPRKEKGESLGAVMIGVNSKVSLPCVASVIVKESAAHPGKIADGARPKRPSYTWLRISSPVTSLLHRLLPSSEQPRARISLVLVLAIRLSKILAAS
jgi:hypothetical protein